jgi:hypothetical protein
LESLAAELITLSLADRKRLAALLLAGKDSGRGLPGNG